MRTAFSRKLLTRTSVAFLILAALTHFCAATPGSQGKWTVMVYMNAKNSLECFGLQNFKQMAAVGSTDDVNVVVEFGRPKNHQDGCADNPETWSGVLRYRVTAGMQPTIANATPDSQKKLSATTDMGAKSSLSEFIGWTQQHYKSSHYMLVVWNHGQGWRLEQRIARSGGKETQVARLVRAPENKIVGGVRSVSFDDDTGNYLFNSDISSAIEESMAGKKLDILGFDACLMSMIETAYQTRSSADTLIASEELEPGSGWNYTTLLHTLANPDLSSTEIAKALEVTYAVENGSGYATLSSVRLARVKDLAAAVSAWATALGERINTEATALARARQECKPYGKWFNAGDPKLRTSIDLDRLATLDSQYSADQTVRSAAQAVVHLIEDPELVSTHYASTSSQDGYGSKGISIYFPDSRLAFKADKENSAGYMVGNSDHPVAFVEKEGWARFLQHYYDFQDQHYADKH